MSVSVNGPKTPVTKGSNGIATATLPNVCKMPGPPAPFIPVPLPNIGKTGDKVKGYSKSVKVKKKIVAIKGASFCSIGDMASKGTGGGLLSSNTHGPCKFISPGSMDVKFEGKNVHLLSDLVTNNGGPSGSPPNSATMMGAVQMCGTVVYVPEGECPICNNEHEDFTESEETKVSADGLVRSYENAEGELNADNRGGPKMIGVVHCKCGGHQYANLSGGARVTFYQAAAGMHTIGKANNKEKNKSEMVLNNMRRRFTQNKKFRQALRLAHMESVTGHAKFPPGQCAAQGALVLALDHGCVPTALTEKWYSREGPTASRVVYNSNQFGNVKGSGTPVARQFRQGESVPPCETCNLLVPFLTCQAERECIHVAVDYSCGGC